MERENRDSIIVRTSVVGIAANVLLAVFKAVVGTLSHSVAIVMDAVNNLSDAMSSLITIIGTKLAGKQPDKKHPMGYGRVEDLSASIISVIVLYAGVSSMAESVKKILHPESADYSALTLIIVAVAVVVKILLGLYVQGKGHQTNSDSLVASGKDAMFDSIISASTLAAAAIYIFTGVGLEAWLSTIISAIIIKSGVDMLRGTISQILGERADPELTKGIRETIAAFPGVQGVHDLILNSYGPNTTIGSVHIEVPHDMYVGELDDLQYRIVEEVIARHHVVLTGISVYAIDNDDPLSREMVDRIHAITGQYPEVINMHGFHLDRREKVIKFDIIVSFDVKKQEDRIKIYQEIRDKVQAEYPDYSLQVTLDSDISD